MQHVYTDDYGYGQVVESKVTRGRTEYRVAGPDFDVWMPATKVAFAPVDRSNSVDLPYDPAPQFGVGPLTESTIQPIHEIDADERTSPADSQTFENRSRDEGDERGEPGPNPDLFAKSAALGDYPRGAGGIEAGPDEAHAHWMDQNQGQAWEHESPYYQGGDGPSQDYMDHHGTEGWLPEDEDPLAAAMAHEDSGHDPGDHERMNADYWRGQDAELNRFGSYHEADVLNTDVERTPFEPDYMIVNDTDDDYLRDVDVQEDERETTGPEGIVHFAGRIMHANPAAALAVPLARGLATGLAGGAAERVMGGGSNDMAAPPQGGEEQGGAPGNPVTDLGNKAKEQLTKEDPLPLPDLGYGWGDMTGKMGSYRPAGLDERYADITASVDPMVAQFRNDPAAFIERVGHSQSEGLNPRIAQYGEMVEADEMLRTAAWADVRAKAKRLRAEGRVHVKDVDYDRIYATVQGDHGTYETMIKKGGAYGGNGGQSITHWHCGCEWGKWAFARRLTFVGRLCSHGYAAYQEMQSAHVKGKPRRQRKNPRNASVHEANPAALLAPLVMRALPSLAGGAIGEHLSDDEGGEGGGGMMGAISPASAILGSTHYAGEDETTQDWKVKGTGEAKSALEDIRDWAETPQEDDFGNMENRVEEIRDAVERAREQGVDADQLVASLRRQAAPGDDPFAPGSPLGGQPPAQDPTGGGLQNPAAPRPPGGSAAPGQIGPFPAPQSVADQQRAPETATPLGELLGAPPPSAPAPSTQAQSPTAGPGTGNSEGIQGPGIPGNPGAPAESVYKDWYGDPGADADTGTTDQSSGSTGGGGGGGGAATPGTGDSATPDVALDAASGGEASAPGSAEATTDAATNPATDEQQDTANTEGTGTGAPDPMSSDTGSSMGGFDMSQIGDTVSGISDAVSSGVGAATDIASSIGDMMSSFTASRQASLEADPEWIKLAYPDGAPDHKPFNGSGGTQKVDWEQSKDVVKEHYSDGIEDVTEVPDESYLTKDLEPERKKWAEGAVGIQRAGSGPRRYVEPEVVSVRGPRKQTVEAAFDPADDFDPLAPRTAASFLDEEPGAPIDIVAQFQAANADLMSANSGPAKTQYDDFSDSPAFKKAMQRTAGRQYSLAEQAALVAEGKKGGARNLDQLDLRGTHYEAEHSVGLW
ncbi:hypothetical protein MYRNA_96 [Mycobacterium phage Myrna]|uniref:Uncharacterized protein n=1 Tax=Mycobacterium phage Myrna TaxID=546805 RepID=B5LJA0_9CAUD|nr:gp96 [Mycobacterium phage Myrna]ACH62097.1 hypothetical protein MYRNA_96 [Mycobacterium phage Myrna]